MRIRIESLKPPFDCATCPSKGHGLVRERDWCLQNPCRCRSARRGRRSMPHRTGDGVNPELLASYQSLHVAPKLRGNGMKYSRCATVAAGNHQENGTHPARLPPESVPLPYCKTWASFGAPPLWRRRQCRAATHATGDILGPFPKAPVGKPMDAKNHSVGAPL